MPRGCAANLAVPSLQSGCVLLKPGQIIGSYSRQYTGFIGGCNYPSWRLGYHCTKADGYGTENIAAVRVVHLPDGCGNRTIAYCTASRWALGRRRLAERDQSPLRAQYSIQMSDDIGRRYNKAILGPADPSLTVVRSGSKRRL
jgi:hypothetical protein